MLSGKMPYTKAKYYLIPFIQNIHKDGKWIIGYIGLRGWREGRVPANRNEYKVSFLIYCN